MAASNLEDMKIANPIIIKGQPIFKWNLKKKIDKLYYGCVTYN